MTEEIEVNVRQIDDSSTSTYGPTQAVEVLRKLMLAGVGAFALSRDEAETFVNRLTERGEIAQKDGEKLMGEVVERFRTQPQAQVNQFGSQFETGFEQFLNRMNVPSKRDIDDLSAKIAQLAARVEELRRTQDVNNATATTAAMASPATTTAPPAAGTTTPATTAPATTATTSESTSSTTKPAKSTK